MSATITVPAPSLPGFTEVGDGMLRREQLTLTLLTGRGYLKDVEDLLDLTFKPNSRLVVMPGFSPADAVWWLNRRLSELGINMEYSLKGLPTEHVPHPKGVYTSCWVAGHVCTGDELSSLREMIQKLGGNLGYWTSSTISALLRTGRPDLYEVEYFQYQPTKTRQTALWTTSDFPPFSLRDIYVLWHEEEGYVVPDRTFYERKSYPNDEFTRDCLVKVDKGDLILTNKTKRCLENGEEVVPAYVVSDIIHTPNGEHWVEAKLSWIPISKFPARESEWIR